MLEVVPMTIVASVAVDTALLILKIAFLVLLYLFIWRIVRTASRDLRLPQESFILAPSREGGVALAQSAIRSGKLVVVKSLELDEGLDFELNSAQLTIGRGGQNDISLSSDEYASAQHARFEPRKDGVWVQDLGSTNGTYLNGARLERPRRLTRGDVIRVGETDLRYDG
jgi:predicted component of type VI protein secretion system